MRMDQRQVLLLAGLRRAKVERMAVRWILFIAKVRLIN